MLTYETGVSAERKVWLKNRRIKRIAISAARLFILVGFLTLWELLAQYAVIDPFIMSCPSRITKTIVNLWNQGELFYHIWITTSEAVCGFVFGCIFGTVIAACLWCSDFVCAVLEPYLVILNALPKIALGPVFIVWIGAGPKSIVAIALSITVVVTTLEVLGGFLSTDKDKILLAKTFGAGKLQILIRVVFPANLGVITGSLKISVGMSWVGVIVGEFLISKAGLGYLIVYGSQVFQLDLVMASVVILALVAMTMYLCIQYTERLLSKRTGSDL